MFFNPNLNIPMGLDTVRDGPNRVFLDPYGVLNPSLSPGEAAYNTTVRLLTTEYGYNDVRRAQHLRREAVLAITSASAAHIPTASRAA